MKAATVTALRIEANRVEEMVENLTTALRVLIALNAKDPLPEGFVDLQMDLASVKGTLDRVGGEIRAAVPVQGQLKVEGTPSALVESSGGESLRGTDGRVS